nr:hypothetical protein [Angustibacter aerolatus]
MLIVDEHTGRILAGRRYNEGMHQAIEAKEGCRSRTRTRRWRPSPCRTTSACTTRLSGMTGTALTEAAEFNQIYKARCGRDPDQPLDGPQGPARPGVPHRGGQVRRRRRRHRRPQQGRPAGARRHHERREERVPVPAACASAASPTRC